MAPKMMITILQTTANTGLFMLSSERFIQVDFEITIVFCSVSIWNLF